MAFVSDELISDQWIAEVEKIFGARDDGASVGDGDGDGGVSIGRSTGRVPDVVAKEKAEAYAPQTVSLGPYYHRALKDAPIEPLHHDLSRISKIEMYKLECIKDAAGYDPRHIQDFLATTIQPNKKSELEQFYNWKLDMEDALRKFGWMMTVDTFFLYQFLKDACDRAGDHDLKKSRHPSATGSIKCDIVKLENQVPLFLLKQVHGDNGFDEFLQSRMASLCSFKEFECSSVQNVGKEQHLLGYMHKCISSFLGMQGEVKPNCCQRIQIAIGKAISNVFRVCCFPQAKTGRTDIKTNASKLVKHGITLKPFTLGKDEQRIRFDRYSGTLYLPRLTVTEMFTEVVLRNLLALEFIETNQETVITQYVELMKSLIGTAKDVKVLRKCRIIVPGSNMITDDYIAAMWKDICSPFFAASVQPSLDFKRIKESLHRNYYTAKGKAICLSRSICLVKVPFRLVQAIFTLA